MPPKHTNCQLCGLQPPKYMIPYYLCKTCWVDYIVDETETIPGLTTQQKTEWKKQLLLNS